MAKTLWKPGTMLYPLPAVMVSCGTEPSDYNIITVSWTGTVASDPPMCYVSIRPERHSYELINKTGVFVINLTTVELARATDWCGVRSGQKFDKFKEMELTPEKGSFVDAPMIAESPVNIECSVSDIIPLGTHHMFLARVLGVHADEKYINQESGAFHFDKAQPICYSHGKYYEVGKFIGKFGFSVRKRKKKKRG